jgi:hypothetical protein
MLGMHTWGCIKGCDSLRIDGQSGCMLDWSGNLYQGTSQEGCRRVSLEGVCIPEDDGRRGDASGRTHQRRDANRRRESGRRGCITGEMLRMHPGRRGCIWEDASWERCLGYTQDGEDASGRDAQDGEDASGRTIVGEMPRMYPGRRGCILKDASYERCPGRGRLPGQRGCIRKDAL